jgi:hypothetical protein
MPHSYVLAEAIPPGVVVLANDELLAVYWKLVPLGLTSVTLRFAPSYPTGVTPEIAT